MIINENIKKIKTFDYYLRHCKICGEIYKAYPKNGKRTKSRICDSCKKTIFVKRNESILKTKQLIKEVEDEYNRTNNIRTKSFI